MRLYCGRILSAIDDSTTAIDDSTTAIDDSTTAIASSISLFLILSTLSKKEHIKGILVMRIMQT
jgi:hypothetical protein